MAEEQITVAKPEDQKVIFEVKSNPFGDGIAAPVEKKEEAAAAAVEEKAAEVATGDADTFDADEYLKKELGWESWDAAKAAKAELEELKKQPKPEPFKFDNAESEKYFNAIKEGKEDDIYSILTAKKQLEKAEKLDPSKPKDAAEIIKLDLLYKNKDKGLDPEDVDFLFEEKFSLPEKPKQGESQADDEYQSDIKKWEAQVAKIERRLVVEAKMAKPELSKFKSGLALPDIPKVVPQPEPPSQESLAAAKAVRDNYLQAVESGYTKFDSYTTKVKDESVELPISFKVPDEDKAAIKKLMQEIDVDEYFGNRWCDEKGNWKIDKMMADLYLLEKSEKVFQGISNNAAAAHFANYQKNKQNINLNGKSPQPVLKPDPKTAREKEESAIWSA